MNDKTIAWNEVFQVEKPERESDLETRVPGACSENCMMARELKCVCQCGGANHGAGLRKNVKSLDEFNGEGCDHKWVWLIGRSQRIDEDTARFVYMCEKCGVEEVEEGPPVSIHPIDIRGRKRHYGVADSYRRN